MEDVFLYFTKEKATPQISVCTSQNGGNYELGVTSRHYVHKRQTAAHMGKKHTMGIPKVGM